MIQSLTPIFRESLGLQKDAVTLDGDKAKTAWETHSVVEAFLLTLRKRRPGSPREQRRAHKRRDHENTSRLSEISGYLLES